jgi:hypothetical protein
MHLNQSAASDSYILANNWDRFGGRVLDILNGYTLSIKLQCNFAFYWPDDPRFQEMDEQINFFSSDFIKKFRINENPPSSQIRFIDFNELTRDSAKEVLIQSSNVTYFKNPNFFALPKFLDEDEKAARDSYIQCGLAIISSLNVELWEKIKKSYSDFDSIHARYGDLLDGSFNQFVDARKYVDTFNLHTLAKKLSLSGRKLVILTDTPEISLALENLTKCILRPNLKSFETSKSLSLFELQTIELFILASSKCIYAPNLSAFSFLASRLGGNELRFIRSETVDEFYFDERRTSLRKHYRNFPKKIKHQTSSRDLVSVLQHHWKGFELKKIAKIIKLAQRQDSNYITSICLSGILAALESNEFKSKLLIERAEILARSKLKIHHDPLFLTLIVKYCTLDDRLHLEKNIILTEIKNLAPYQISKVSALNFLEGFDRLYKNSAESCNYKIATKRQVQTKVSEMWNRIVESRETDLVYGLLNLLQAKRREICP